MLLKIKKPTPMCWIQGPHQEHRTDILDFLEVSVSERVQAKAVWLVVSPWVFLWYNF